MYSKPCKIDDSTMNDVAGGVTFPMTFPAPPAVGIDKRLAFADELAKEALRNSEIGVQAALNVSRLAY